MLVLFIFSWRLSILRTNSNLTVFYIEYSYALVNWWFSLFKHKNWADFLSVLLLVIFNNASLAHRRETVKAEKWSGEKVQFCLFWWFLKPCTSQGVLLLCPLAFLAPLLEPPCLFKLCPTDCMFCSLGICSLPFSYLDVFHSPLGPALGWKSCFQPWFYFYLSPGT